ncbi:MAG: hypothetical protein M2R45_03070 [Verrucomicrobia subdivision 3 bacterium]|nr:hypothetical protein [Limisphaerales bacterium]MCS1416556.1 hypothetical protein [Limisphaerales bacterium]
MHQALQQQYDEAMFVFSQENYTEAARLLEAILLEDPNYFEARLSLGMAFCRMGAFERAIVEGHKAEALKPNEQLVHTNLSLFYMRLGDKTKAEHHGLQARIVSWKGSMDRPAVAGDAESSDLNLAKPTPKTYKTPEKFPDMPWKKKQD